MNPKDFRNPEAGNVIRTKTGYWAFVPARLPPEVNWTEPLINALSDAEREPSKLATLSSSYPFPHQFEAIHPFLDGNGRIGRLLILLLYEWQLLPQPPLNLSAHFEHYRQEYYDRMLGVSQRGKWHECFMFFFRGLGARAQDSVVRMTRLQNIRAKFR